MANTYELTTFMANLMALGLTQKNAIYQTGSHEYEDYMIPKNYKTGGVVNIKQEPHFSVVRGLSLVSGDVQGLSAQVVTITITEQNYANIPVELSVFEQDFKVVGGTKALTDMGRKRVADNYGASMYKDLSAAMEVDCYNELAKTAHLSTVQDPDNMTAISTFSDVNAANTLMSKLKINNNPCGMMNLTDSAKLSDSLQNAFNEGLNKTVSMSGRVNGSTRNRLAGFDLYDSADFSDHTAGNMITEGGTLTVKSSGGISADGKTINFTRSVTTNEGLIKAGDMFAIPSVSLFVPMGNITLADTLVVTALADVTVPAATADFAVTVDDPIVATGLFANVAALPAGSAPVKMFPNHRKNFFYPKAGLTVASLPIANIEGATNGNSKQTGLDAKVKVTIQGDVLTGNNIFRLYTLFVTKAFPRHVVVIPSKI